MSALVRKVRVISNPLKSQGWPWLVLCENCSGDEGFLGALMGVGRKGWAATWRQAMDYATSHARQHEERRCPTCLHVPTGLLPSEEKTEVPR